VTDPLARADAVSGEPDHLASVVDRLVDPVGSGEADGAVRAAA
jgi:hypothetical protein